MIILMESPTYFIYRYIVYPSIHILELDSKYIEIIKPVVHYALDEYRVYLKESNVDVLDGANFNDDLVYKKVPVHYYFEYGDDGNVIDRGRIMPRHNFWLMENAPTYPHMLLYHILYSFLRSKKTKHYYNKYIGENDRSKWLTKMKRLQRLCYRDLFRCQYSDSMIHESYDIGTFYSVFLAYEKVGCRPSHL